MATTAQQSKTNITSGQGKLTEITIMLKSGNNITRDTDRKFLIPNPSSVQADPNLGTQTSLRRDDASKLGVGMARVQKR